MEQNLCRSETDGMAVCTKAVVSTMNASLDPKYHTSNYERGAVRDFVNYPMNNRWWHSHPPITWSNGSHNEPHH